MSRSTRASKPLGRRFESSQAHLDSSDGCSRQTVSMVRIDKWLWAARFFKTRGLAAAAVAGGRAHLNGERVKPSKEVRLADRIEVRVGQAQWTVVVTGLSDKRGPAGVAAGLYEETA